ncbi:MAG: CapA family protein [Clostridiaceae bacterium]
MRRGIIAAIIVIAVLAAGLYVLEENQYISTGENVLDTAAEISQTTQQDEAAQHNKPSTNTGTGDGMNGGSAAIKGGDISSAQQTLSMDVVKQEPELRFLAVGDIMLGRGVGMRLQKAGNYEMAFEKVASLLKQGDIVFANLESPFTESTHCLDKKGKIVLKAKPEASKALTSAGFNLLSLSNNHMLDYYETGLFDTMKVLEENHISYAGGGKNLEEARKPAIIEKNGLKIGLLAYTDMAELIFAGNPYLSFAAKADKSGLVPRKYETVREDIMKLRGQVDLLAVSLHWGTEDSFTVTPEQIEFARKLIDDGADIILGHHPHQFQGMEIYKGKPILYSMGNFLFDQNDPENMESFIIDMKYKGTELTELSAIPVRILDKSYVEVQTGQNAVNILERQANLCTKLGTIPLTDADKLVIKP